MNNNWSNSDVTNSHETNYCFIQFRTCPVVVLVVFLLLLTYSVCLGHSRDKVWHLNTLGDSSHTYTSRVDRRQSNRPLQILSLDCFLSQIKRSLHWRCKNIITAERILYLPDDNDDEQEGMPPFISCTPIIWSYWRSSIEFSTMTGSFTPSGIVPVSKSNESLSDVIFDGRCNFKITWKLASDAKTISSFVEVTSVSWPSRIRYKRMSWASHRLLSIIHDFYCGTGFQGSCS